MAVSEPDFRGHRVSQLSIDLKRLEVALLRDPVDFMHFPVEKALLWKIIDILLPNPPPEESSK